MSDILNRAASITPPVSGKNTIVRSSLTTAGGEKIKIPTDWLKGYLTVQAQGVDVFFALGDSNVTVDETATSTLASSAVSAHGSGECQYVAAGANASVDLTMLEITPGTDVYVCHKESATGGKIRLLSTSGRRPIK